MIDEARKGSLNRRFLKGLAASDGIGVGTISIFQHEKYCLTYGEIKESKINTQLKLLHKALKRTKKELAQIKEQVRNLLHDNEKAILDSYSMILEDEYFIAQIENIIKSQKLSAEHGVEICFDQCIREMSDNSNEYIKQRIHDLNDLKVRWIKNILGECGPSTSKILHKHIVAVKELTPSVAAVLGKKRVQGILADEGGSFFSHSAILLRGLGIPLINDVNYVNIEKYGGCKAILDGHEGIVIINPEMPEIKRYSQIIKSNLRKQKEQKLHENRVTKTMDGKIIKILANVSSTQQCSLVLDKKMDGVGLVRTELLFADWQQIPDEGQQLQEYITLAKKIKSKPIIFRTWDLGGDKHLGRIPETELEVRGDNRGIQRSLLHPEEFSKQIRAILKTLTYGEISLAFPMVNSEEEIKLAKLMIKKQRKELMRLQNSEIKMPQIGAFIETRRGIENLDFILKEVGFINIGTNDLFEDFSGYKRHGISKEEADFFQPEFLRLLQLCIRKVKRKKKRLVVCGEMASDPWAAILLIGMGVEELSMSPSKTAEVRATLSKIKLTDAKIISEKAIRSVSATQVKEMIIERVRNAEIK